jgi:pyridoxamine 5'-phosphate oxidase
MDSLSFGMGSPAAMTALMPSHFVALADAPKEWSDGFDTPLLRFLFLYDRARTAEPFDHTALVLATATPDGIPSARVVLLKAADEHGFLIVGNYESRKACELAANPRAALCFYYPTLNEQCRVEGTVVKASPEESDAYFATRPRTSQLGAWASTQSRFLSTRQELLDRVEAFDQKYRDQDVPRPPHWGGLRIVPSAYEFWRDGAFRLHDRFRYECGPDGNWTVGRISP